MVNGYSTITEQLVETEGENRIHNGRVSYGQLYILDKLAMCGHANTLRTQEVKWLMAQCLGEKLPLKQNLAEHLELYAGRSYWLSANLINL